MKYATAMKLNNILCSGIIDKSEQDQVRLVKCQNPALYMVTWGDNYRHNISVEFYCEDCYNNLKDHTGYWANEQYEFNTLISYLP